MDRHTQKLLWDVLEHAREILHMTEGLTYEQYEKDRKLMWAVERCFEIIGDSMDKADKGNPDLAITDKKKIIGLRIKLAHHYDDVEQVNIWSTIKNHLPKLIEETEKLLYVK